MNPRQSLLKLIVLGVSLVALLPLALSAQRMPERGGEPYDGGWLPGGPYVDLATMLPSRFGPGPRLAVDLPGREDLPSPFWRELRLTEAQRDQVFSITHIQAPKLREKAKTARKAQEELRVLALSDQFDEAKAKALAESAAWAMLDIALLRATADHQVYALLTLAQREQVEVMRMSAR